MKVKKRRYGWKPDLPDPRDHAFKGPRRLARLPPRMDLRAEFPAPYDQGELGSCTANAIAAAVQLLLARRDRQTAFMPSRLMIYYEERRREGTIESDAGAFIRDGIKVVAKVGAAPEPLWPYVPRKFKVAPTAKAYNAAAETLAGSYERLSGSVRDLKGCLAQSLPVVFGFTVPESFEGDDVARTGVMAMPGATERMLGGHAVLAVGYDDSRRAFLIRNSWGPRWGEDGHFWMPYDFLANRDNTDDFWTIREIAAKAPGSAVEARP